MSALTFKVVPRPTANVRTPPVETRALFIALQRTVKRGNAVQISLNGESLARIRQRYYQACARHRQRFAYVRTGPSTIIGWVVPRPRAKKSR